VHMQEVSTILAALIVLSLSEPRSKTRSASNPAAVRDARRPRVIQLGLKFKF
jgi:hypothetical protein